MTSVDLNFSFPVSRNSASIVLLVPRSLNNLVIWLWEDVRPQKFGQELGLDARRALDSRADGNIRAQYVGERHGQGF